MTQIKFDYGPVACARAQVNTHRLTDRLTLGHYIEEALSKELSIICIRQHRTLTFTPAKTDC